MHSRRCVVASVAAEPATTCEEKPLARSARTCYYSQIMKVFVNGIHLYFDVEGMGLTPKNNSMEEKPTLLMLHGGPGADHTHYKPAFSALTDIAQIVYLDHRGNGRSDPDLKANWTLSQWADDVHAFCVALGIERPLVYGSSFGGMVAMAYAVKYPSHPGKLVLVSTTAQATSHTLSKVAMFAKLGGAEAGELAHQRFVQGDTSAEVLDAWIEVALPLYTQTGFDRKSWQRQILNQEVREWFYGADGEGRCFDLLPHLQRIQCETLVLGGVLDPMVPIECQRDIASAIKPELIEYHEFPHCGHGVIADANQEAMATLRRFIQGSAATD